MDNKVEKKNGMKWLLLVLLLVIIAVVVMCIKTPKTKTLSCVSTTNYVGEDKKKVETTIKDEVVFKDDKISKATVEISYELSNTTSEAYDIYVKGVSTMYKEASEDGLTIKITNDKENYKYTVVYTADFNKVSKETLEKYNSTKLDKILEEKTFEKVETLLTNGGFTCTK